MQKQHLLQNSFFTKFPFLDVVCAVYIFFLPVFGGKILTDSLSWYQGMYVNYFQFRITLHLILAIIVLSVFIWHFWKRYVTQKVIILSLLALTFFCIYNFCITNLHYSVDFAFVSTFKLFELVITATALVITIIVFTKSVIDNKNKQLFIGAILISGVLQLVLSIIQVLIGKPLFPELLYILGQPKVFESYTFVGVNVLSRAYGTTPHPNILAGIMVFFSLLFVIDRRVFWQKFLLLLPFVAVIALTLSRSGLLALVAGVSVIAIIQEFWSKKWMQNMTKILQNDYFLAIRTLLILITGTLLTLLLGKIENLPYFFETRIVLLRSYLGIIMNKNILGILFGNGFLSSIPQLVKESANLNTSLIFHNSFLIEPPHNGLVLLINELGVIGTATIFIGGFYLFHWAFSIIGENKEDQKKETSRLTALKVSLVFVTSILLLLDHYLIY